MRSTVHHNMKKRPIQDVYICKVIVEAFKSKVLNGLVGEELLCLTLSFSPLINNLVLHAQSY